MMNSLLCFTLLAISVSATPLSTPPYNAPAGRSPYTLAPLMAAEHPHGSVNSSYIVMLKDNVHPSVLDNHMNFLTMAHEADPLQLDGAESGLRHVYNHHNVKGYSGLFTDSVVERIRAMPEVEYVERDQIVRTQEVQKSAPWGLARISHRKRLTFATFTRYLFSPKGGEGVDVYVIDTGINIAHVEFEGRAKWGKTMPDNDEDLDGNGHGSHCAGTIASRKYGVAKGANVIAVKVLGSNGSGTMSDVVGGVGWAVDQAVEKDEAARAEYAATGKTSHKGSVASMSLGGGPSPALDRAINKAATFGVHFAVAAGNDNKDACNYSPAAAEAPLTVGASTLGDERAYFSNYGPCVDVFAPGLNILSTWTGSPYATNTISGTSMACPHVAGLLAYLLSIYPSQEFSPVFDAEFATLMGVQTSGFTSLYAVVHAVLPSWASTFLPPPRMISFGAEAATGPASVTPAQLKKALLALSTKGVLTDIPAKTPNLLIFNNATA
ncbi:hypothetical protein FIBSPDRAFT_780867 [Athelia psychrophila]|uniref:Uncharacterized protein n=1 Tax=Athelia psychrophila TaxID=1759441 RepID=A0A166QWN3_9AGAM|nr:hypothetical protein FIBSPDRAFT_780867 [Fibularhizoctonia sp. CBS 109695]